MTTKNLFLGLVSFVWVVSACTYDTIPLPADCPEPPSIIIVTVEDSDCALQNGSITVEGSGGEAPYIFRLSTGTENTDGIFSNLPTGSFSITIEDVNGCTSESDFQIKNKNGLNIQLNFSNSGCETSTGSISVQGEGGVEPYEFKLNGQSFQNSGEFNQLSPGEYSVVAKDATGCEISQTLQILSDVAFQEIKAIVSANCAVSGCHNGSISPDFRNDETIQSRASRIQSRTSSRSMPPSSSGRSLSTSEIADIACWVTDGAPL